VIPLRDLVPVRRRPWVTYGLIAANVVIYGYEALLPDDAARLLAYRHGLVPAMFVQHLGPDTFGTVFTSMFLHGGFLHVLSNMWFLHIFGDNVEDALGRMRFLLFYLAAGVCAALTHVLIDVDSQTPMVGASGAIAGVLGAYIRLYPRARVVTLIPIVVIMLVRELPAVFFIVVWFLIQLLSGFGSLGGPDQGGGVAFFAHIGGFVAGLLLVNLFAPRRNDAADFASPLPAQRYRVREPWEP
jgi:membrane associated rhomboid family serine protease